MSRFANPALPRLRLVKPRQRRDLDDALVPLINVVFLMLIFFMIAGRITTPDALRVEPPTSAQGRPLPPAPVVLLMDAQGNLAWEGQVISLPELETRLAEWTAGPSGRSGINGRLPDVEITLKADAAVRQAQLRPLLERLQAAGVEQLRLSSKPALE